jgi:hypothetical protein
MNSITRVQVQYIQRELQQRKKYNYRYKQYISEFFDEKHPREVNMAFFKENRENLELAWEDHESYLLDQDVMFSRRFGGISSEARSLLSRDYYLYDIWRLLEDLYEASFSDEEDDFVLSSLDAPETTDSTLWYFEAETTYSTLSRHQEVNVHLEEEKSNYNSLTHDLHTNVSGSEVTENFWCAPIGSASSLSTSELLPVDNMCESFTNGDVEFSGDDGAHESTDLAPVTRDSFSETESIRDSYSFTSVIKECSPLVGVIDEDLFMGEFFCRVLLQSFNEVSSKFLDGQAFPVCFVPDPGGLCREEVKSVGENYAKNRQIISFREEDIVKLDDVENMLSELSLELSEILGETNGCGRLIQFTEGVSDDVLDGLTAEFEDFIRETECLEWGASERNSNMIEDSEDELVDDSFEDSEYKMLADSLCHCYYREVISNGIYTVIYSSEHLGIENIMTLAVSSLYTLAFSSALISSIDASCYHISKDTVSYFLNQHSSMKFFWLWLKDSELLSILFMYKWIDKICNWLYLLLFQWFLMHFSSLKGHSVVVSELF